MHNNIPSLTLTDLIVIWLLSLSLYRKSLRFHKKSSVAREKMVQSVNVLGCFQEVGISILNETLLLWVISTWLRLTDITSLKIKLVLQDLNMSEKEPYMNKCIFVNWTTHHFPFFSASIHPKEVDWRMKSRIIRNFRIYPNWKCIFTENLE